ncbi:MAG: CBS domain-containing protein [Candidatus Hodarchaeales archaeon]|jgi:CBS domain-containing protein
MISEVKEVLVGDLLKSKIISMSSDLPVTEAAKLMKNNMIGSVIVKNKEIEGIITKGDIIQRVVGKALDPGIILVGDVMSKPVSYVPADESLENTMLQMSNQQIERILVVDVNDHTKPLGIVSTNDLLKFAPELLSIRRELQQITSSPDFELNPPLLQGFCDDCGNFSDKLSTDNGYVLCSKCVGSQSGEFRSDDDEIM